MAIMISIEILAFGIAKDIIGASKMDYPASEGTTVEQLRESILERYPAFMNLTSLAIAVNSEYAEGDQIIKAGDEVVLIPPVSGG